MIDYFFVVDNTVSEWISRTKWTRFFLCCVF